MKKLLDKILKVRLPIVLAVFGLTFVATFYATMEERDGVGYQPEQPIKFSHALHAGKMDIDCQYCHTGVEKSRHAGVPSASICMNCHTVARTETPEIQKLVKEYYNKGIPIPWKRVHRVADFAYFDHSAHVLKGINCAHCHGDMTKTTVVAQKKNFMMGACIDCHRNAHKKMPELKDKIKLGPENCYTCHR